MSALFEQRHLVLRLIDLGFDLGLGNLLVSFAIAHTHLRKHLVALFQCNRVHLVMYPVASPLVPDQAGIFEDLQVLGNGRGRDAQNVRDVVDTKSPLMLQKFYDPDARFHTQDFEFFGLLADDLISN